MLLQGLTITSTGTSITAFIPSNFQADLNYKHGGLKRILSLKMINDETSLAIFHHDIKAILSFNKYQIPRINLLYI